MVLAGDRAAGLAPPPGGGAGAVPSRASVARPASQRETAWLPAPRCSACTAAIGVSCAARAPARATCGAGAAALGRRARASAFSGMGRHYPRGSPRDNRFASPEGMGILSPARMRELRQGRCLQAGSTIQAP